MSEHDTTHRPFEDAWRRLAADLRANWRDVTSRGQFDLSKTFGAEAPARAIDVHLYFVGLLAARLRTDGVRVDLEPFERALRARKPHPDVSLLIANSYAPPGKLVLWDAAVSVLAQGEEVWSAMWVHWEHPIAVKTCYVKTGAPVRTPEGFPWHPSRQRKIVKLSPFKGDAQPLVSRRDLRI
jgi:hypothetical protein